MGPPIRIVIAGGYRIIRRGLHLLLDSREGFQVIGEAADVNEAVEKTRELEPDIVLVITNFAEFEKGVRIISTIRNEIHSAHILALTNAIQDSGVYSLLKAGAHGYVLKDHDIEDLFNAVTNVSRGAPWIQDTIMQKLLGNLGRPKGSPRMELSQRETEVLGFLARGYSNRSIAEKLFISDKTVRTHVSNILNKLNLKSRTQAALYALHGGLTEL